MATQLRPKIVLAASVTETRQLPYPYGPIFGDGNRKLAELRQEKASWVYAKSYDKNRTGE